MKIQFSRRGLSYSLLKEEVTRVIAQPETEDIIEKPFLFRILDGLPTIIFEPDGLFVDNEKKKMLVHGCALTFYSYSEEMVMLEELFS